MGGSRFNSEQVKNKLHIKEKKRTHTHTTLNIPAIVYKVIFTINDKVPKESSNTLEVSKAIYQFNPCSTKRSSWT